MEAKVFPEIWGGIECTVNRVGDQYVDQLTYSGHYTREDDIEKIAALGIKMLRYPVLWEHHEITKGCQVNWKRTAVRLEKIRACNITPIAGLLHHGSGPAFTNLLDEEFPQQLAQYAGSVAAKFPWIEYYTPVNEPLTTARFSGLYGHWYPHHSNDISFARMLINQVKGIILSMKAIRKINPEAKLVQTEDLGKAYSTEALSFQARFENERRWLTYDLLCGKLAPGYMMWDYFIRLGISAAELQFFRENPCVPDIAGFNYYITSERFLDDRLENYPAHTHGGNELQRYADVEAVRVAHGQPWGRKLLFTEAWERFRLPMAVTECHLNCYREEQLRWFMQTLVDVNALVNEGIPVKAVIAWSLLGSYGWDKLLTSEDMNYEPGLFDIRAGDLRPTALAKLVKAVINKETFHHLSMQEGWWQKNQSAIMTAIKEYQQPLLITGSMGNLGYGFKINCKERGIKYYAATRREADITDMHQVEELLLKIKPWAVINAAGFVDVDKAENDAATCYAVNTAGAVLLATACRKYNIKFLSFSSDLVFNGKKSTAFTEKDEVDPLNIYGKSKALAEEQLLFVNPDALIIRTSAFFGPWDQANFAVAVINTLSANKVFKAASDIIISPTYVPHLVQHALDLLIDDEKGIWHLANDGALSWAAFAEKIAFAFALDTTLINSLPASEMKWVAERPSYSALTSCKAKLLPSLDHALACFAVDLKTEKSLLQVI